MAVFLKQIYILMLVVIYMQQHTYTIKLYANHKHEPFTIHKRHQYQRMCNTYSRILHAKMLKFIIVAISIMILILW